MNQNFYCPITQEVMKDPVIGPDGVTYERTAIESWFAAGHATSPLTRQPMTNKQLTPNLALRGAIEDALAAGWSPVVLAAGAAAAAPPPPPTLELGRLHDRRLYVRALASGDTLLPTLFIDVLDISGSMGDSSVDATQAVSEAAAFSRSDLVRHSVATQIELLRPTDELALVLFDNNATVALEPTPMSVHGKLAAKACLPLIHPNGGTNIWLGLQRALQIADRACQADKERNVVIILQTDGESDPSYNPPRGIVDTFKSWRDAHPAARLTVHTVGYGFGKALDMPLLRLVAEVGDGTVSYIPDGSMVGTVFIHLMSNLMSAAYRNVQLKIPELGICETVGFLQPGQRREFVFPAPAEGEAFTVTLEAGVHTVEQAVANIDELPYTELDGPITALRQDFLQILRDSLAKAEGGDVEAGAADLASFVARLDALHDPVCDDRRIWALRTDIEDADKYKGQISKAFASPANFERWGRHYIPSILCEHERQWPTNFKDETAKILGGDATRALINAGDTIFNALPPPQPSATYAYRGSAAGLLSATTSLAATNSAVGPCFLPASRVLMADGTQRRCDEIRPGDIAAPNYVIRCVVKTEVPYADAVFLTRGHTYEDDHTNRYSKDVVPVHSAYRTPEATSAEAEDRGGFTLWHPVLVNGIWEHPASVGPVRRVTTDAIYNFVLEWAPPDCASGWALRPEVLIINGVTTCTLGHEMTGAVIGHPYFGKRETGKRNILDDLQEQPGWANGYITWSNLQIEHDAQGLIAGMRPAV